MILYRVFAYIKDSTSKKFTTAGEFQLAANVNADEMLDNTWSAYSTARGTSHTVAS